MRCPGCGTELPVAANYCPGCGANSWTTAGGTATAGGPTFGAQLHATARQVLSTHAGRSTVGWAAAGAVVAIPVPVIGPLAGAVIGGVIGYWRNRAQH